MRTLTIHRIIGTGSMGTVYHAELGGPGNAVVCAVKRMKESNPDKEQFRARMRDEARLLGLLVNERILGVQELVRVRGQDCVVMELVDGVDLSQLISDAAIPPRALCEFGADLAATLHRAHEACHPTTGEPLRVIHRDIKPANVMLTVSGAVRLLDFGVARAVFASRESQTQGLVLGTLNYFPPEVLAGGDPTPAVDVYGLGLLLWEAATRKEWGTPQVHRQRFERRLEQRLSDLSAAYEPLHPVLRRLLAWRSEERPPAKEVEALLSLAAEGCEGPALTVWAHTALPPLMSRKQGDQPKDDWVGTAQPVDEESAPVGRSGPDSANTDGLRPIGEALKRSASRPETETFNDFAPPAAVLRPKRDKPRRDTRAAAVRPVPEPTPEPPTDLRATEILMRPTSGATRRTPVPAPQGQSPTGLAPESGIRGHSPEPEPARHVRTPPPPRRRTSDHRSTGEPSWVQTLALVFGALLFGSAVGAGVLFAVVIVGWLVVG